MNQTNNTLFKAIEMYKESNNISQILSHRGNFLVYIRVVNVATYSSKPKYEVKLLIKVAFKVGF